MGPDDTHWKQREEYTRNYRGYWIRVWFDRCWWGDSVDGALGVQVSAVTKDDAMRSIESLVDRRIASRCDECGVYASHSARCGKRP